MAESLQRRFPKTEFDFVYAGIGSTDSTYGAFRLHRDILSKGKVDLLFIESAVNELHNSRTRDDITKAVEGIILQSRRHNPHIDIVAQYLYDMPYVGLFFFYFPCSRPATSGHTLCPWLGPQSPCAR